MSCDILRAVAEGVPVHFIEIYRWCLSNYVCYGDVVFALDYFPSYVLATLAPLIHPYTDSDHNTFIVTY